MVVSGVTLGTGHSRLCLDCQEEEEEEEEEDDEEEEAITGYGGLKYKLYTITTLDIPDRSFSRSDRFTPEKKLRYPSERICIADTAGMQKMREKFLICC
jgi:hypothetical protein